MQIIIGIAITAIILILLSGRWIRWRKIREIEGKLIPALYERVREYENMNDQELCSRFLSIAGDPIKYDFITDSIKYLRELESKFPELGTYTDLSSKLKLLLDRRTKLHQCKSTDGQLAGAIQ